VFAEAAEHFLITPYRNFLDSRLELRTWMLPSVRIKTLLKRIRGLMPEHEVVISPVIIY